MVDISNSYLKIVQAKINSTIHTEHKTLWAWQMKMAFLGGKKKTQHLPAGICEFH